MAVFSDEGVEDELNTKGYKSAPPRPLDDNYWFDPWRHTRTDLSVPASVETPGNAVYYKANHLSYRDKLLGCLRKPSN